MNAASILPWIPVFPLLGFLVNGLIYLASHSKLGDKDAPKGTHGHGDGGDHASHGDGGHGDHHDIPFKAAHTLIGPIASGLSSCLLAFLAIVLWLGETKGDEAVVATVWTWIPMGANPGWFGGINLSVDVAFRLDPLSALMIGFVTFVGTLIHIYSIGYMGHDAGYGRFFSYMNLFMFSMLTLVLGANLGILFVGWEGVGLCSYLLIGYFYDKDFAADAGKKAFVMNRIGDFGFLLGLFGCVAMFGTVDFGAMFAKAAAAPGTYAAGGLVTAAAVCLFIGATGKSAQIPLYVWLPDAMAGPTPVSALIHAATMVTAGVYMVARMNVLFRISHEWALRVLGDAPSVWGLLTHDASFVVAVVGALTAVVAATIALAQNDIKKVLAYSTVSQLGYMFLGCGVLAFDAGMFHVFTHAFFKACLFLCSGSVIHALGGEQDMTKMGGLRKKIPQTFWTMLIATIAISGIPPFAGFFSKDRILGETFVSGHVFLWTVGAVTAGLTAFYMFRLIRMTFYGEFRGSAETWEHVHESPASMTVPLWVLAIGAVVVGHWGMPKIFPPLYANKFEGFLEPIFAKLPADWTPLPHEASHSAEYGLMLLSVAIAAAGIALAVRFYSGAYPFALPEKVVTALPRLYTWVRNKYFVDEAYEWLFVERITKRGGRLLWEVDARVVDGAVNGARHLTVGASQVSSWFDRVFVDGAVNGVADTLQAAWRGARRLQTGQTQGYALAMTVGVFALVFLYIIFA